MNKTESSSNIMSEALCLNRLGVHLLQFFPLTQVQEVLADYQEYLSLGRERGTSPEGLLQELKNPAGIRQELLGEMPEGRRFFFLWTGGWGILFLLTLYVCLHSFSSYLPPVRVLIPLMVCLSVSLFALLHGRSRAVLEQQLGILPVKRSFWLLQLFPPAPTALTEYAMQWLLVRPPESLPTTIGSWPIGPVISGCLCLLAFLLTLLLIGTILKVQKRSIQYFPGIIHSLGTIFFLFDMRAILHNMSLDFCDLEMLRREFILPLYWYVSGLLLALLFVFLLRPGKKSKPKSYEKPIPLCIKSICRLLKGKCNGRSNQKRNPGDVHS